MNQATRQQIFGIIKAATKVDPATMDIHKNLRDLINLDSMQFVAVIAKLENDLGIELPISAMEAETLGEFLAVLDAEIDKAAEPMKN